MRVRTTTLAVLVGLVSVLGACGGDDDDTDGSAAASDDAVEETSDDGDAAEGTDDSDPDAGASTGSFAPGTVALPDHEEIGNPLDDSVPLDVPELDGVGTATAGCTDSFNAATGLGASLADCVHVRSAISEFAAIVATVDSGNELWLACLADDGGYTPVFRWVGSSVQGITPMDDATIGSGLVVSLVDAEDAIHHVVMWDQYEGSPCPTSSVETPGAPGTGPTVQANGVLLPVLNSDGERNDTCFRPVDGVWTRGEPEGAAC